MFRCAFGCGCAEGVVTLRRRRIWSFRSVVSSLPRFCLRMFSVLNKLATVDIAASERDPLRRIAFVAAFAMSNYSSTIGRIAKPFNPMLVSQLFVQHTKPDVLVIVTERNIRICSYR